MSPLETYAEKELKLAGLFDEDSNYGGMLGHAVMKLIKIFADEGHSGFSASLCVDIFNKVSRYQPLTPLTGEDSEWMEIGDGMYQNNRHPAVFKDKNRFDGKPYFLDGKVFRQPDGSCYTSSDSWTVLEFPCFPKTEYVDVPGEE